MVALASIGSELPRRVPGAAPLAWQHHLAAEEAAEARMQAHGSHLAVDESDEAITQSSVRRNASASTVARVERAGDAGAVWSVTSIESVVGARITSTSCRPGCAGPWC